MTSSEKIESIIEQITYTKGVVGVVVCTTSGVPIRDSFQDVDRSQAMAYAELGSELARAAELVTKRDGGLDMLRVRTAANEVLIKANKEYLIVVVQEME